MAKYRTLTKSFINNAIVEAGQIVEFDGKAGSNLELIDDEKPEIKTKGKGKGAAHATSDAGSDAGADLV
jgi:hypothetical protein